MSGFGKGFNYSHFIRNDFAAKIRLGRKREIKGGREVPDGARWDFFVMDDVFEKYPKLLKTKTNPGGVYEKDPKVIHGFMSSMDMELALPAEWAKYGNARKTASGKMAGRRQCSSPGPDLATGQPGVAKWLEKRDASGKVPTRPCLGYDCEDYISGACKMRVYITLYAPHMHPVKPFCLVSTSRRVLENVVSMYERIKDKYGEGALKVPLVFWREPTEITSKEGNSSTMGIINVDTFGVDEYARLFPDAWAAHSGMHIEQLHSLGERQRLAIEAGLENFTDDEHNLTEVDADNVPISENLVVDVGISPYEKQVKEVLQNDAFNKMFLAFVRSFEADPEKAKKKRPTLRQKEDWVRKFGDQHKDLLAVAMNKMETHLNSATESKQ